MSGIGSYIKNGINKIFGKNEEVREQEIKDGASFGEYYDLYPLLCDAVDVLQERTDKKKLDYSLDIAWSTPKQLYGNEEKLKQAVTELLKKAADSAENGKVTFSLEFVKDEEAESVLLQPGVMCTGEGIAEEELSTVKELLKGLGCSLSVEKVPDIGAKYTFGIKQGVAAWEPLGSFENSYRAELKKRVSERVKFIAPQARILVVDDNPMNLQVIKSLLEHTRVMIDTAGDGDSGIALAAENKYDIIFLDHMMPDKDGVETLREMCSDGGRGDTVMVCLTANAISGAKKWYLSEGFDDYLAKPVNAERLEDILLKHLPEAKVIKGTEVYNG